ARRVGEWQVLGAGRPANAVTWKPVVLRRHVVDFEPTEPPDSARVADHDRRLLGVDVDLDRRFVTDDQRGLAVTLDFGSHVIHGEPIAVDDELGAMSPPA